jgi:phage baseplate assembly protein W
MKKEITDAIGRHEPRVSVNEIDIKYEEYGITLNIQYIIKNINRVDSISTSLTRAA